ncbi:A/G-specific adenine glycosylase [Ascidiimonas sp. W6]|uniref:A/G-specific adenine glycosylase n=1 Tax=Ascidiimonas meishanensis TaxID=3128903 RepID=UPI0030EEE70D
MIFSKVIISWYAIHKRDLPWRKTKDPYYIWLSEIMLQQTRVAQGLPYYLKFVERYPTVFDLANAPEDEVLKLWQGLGYYSRARNLHYTAKDIVTRYKGVFPDNYHELLQLKGVGDYTASAIASICFNEATPVVDGNVYRVLARYFGIELPINSTEGVKYFKELAQKYIEFKEPGTYNQAIMEFGANQCKPQSPNCVICPLNENCVALASGMIKKLPVKIKKLKVKKRYFNYLLIHDGDSTLIQQRLSKDIWQHLYELPLIESDNELEKEVIREHPSLRTFTKGKAFQLDLYNQKSLVHKLSHQHIYTRFWIVALEESLDDGIALDSLKDYAVPVLIANFVEEYSF